VQLASTQLNISRHPPLLTGYPTALFAFWLKLVEQLSLHFERGTDYSFAREAAA
jgi:hypothetical protein